MKFKVLSFLHNNIHRYSFLYGALCVITVLTAVVPVRAEVPFVDTAQPEKVVELGFHVGDGVATIRQNYSSQVPSVSDFVLTPGNRFEMGVDAVMPIRNFFAIGTAVNLGFNNYYWTMTMLDRSAGTLTTLYSRNNFTNLTIPAFLRFRFNLGTRVTWESDLGAYISFGMGGTSKFKETASSTNSLGQSQVTETQFRNKYFNEKTPVVNTVTGTDWGLMLGTGFMYNRHWALRCALLVGARDIAKNMGVFNIEIHNLSATVSLGYNF